MAQPTKKQKKTIVCAIRFQKLCKWTFLDKKESKKAKKLKNVQKMLRKS